MQLRVSGTRDASAGAVNEPALMPALRTLAVKKKTSTHRLIPCSYPTYFNGTEHDRSNPSLVYLYCSTTVGDANDAYSAVTSCFIFS